MTIIEAVVFDIGNVLVEWDPDRVYADLIPDPERRAAFYAASGIMAMNEGVDRGDPFAASVQKTAAACPDWHDEITAWEHRWVDMCQPAIDGSTTLLRRLRAKGIAVHALSNFGVETFALAQTLYPVLGEFDIPVISGREKTIKPEALIYEILEERSGLSGDALLFTDDRADNIAAAQSRGWHTHLFETPEGLAEVLMAHGLLSPVEARL